MAITTRNFPAYCSLSPRRREVHKMQMVKSQLNRDDIIWKLGKRFALIPHSQMYTFLAVLAKS